jgi:hypothetical protein
MIFGGQPKITAEHNVIFGGQEWARENKRIFNSFFCR